MKRDVFQAKVVPAIRAIILLIDDQTFRSNAIAKHFDKNRQAVSKH